MPESPSYYSGPVDLGHPSFDSLLSALKAVHEGELQPGALMIYYQALLAEWTTGENELEQRLRAEPGDSSVRFALGSMAITRLALESLPPYVENPSAENMAECVHLLLEAMRVTGSVRALLEQGSVRIDGIPSEAEGNPEAADGH